MNRFSNELEFLLLSLCFAVYRTLVGNPSMVRSFLILFFILFSESDKRGRKKHVTCTLSPAFDSTKKSSIGNLMMRRLMSKEKTVIKSKYLWRWIAIESCQKKIIIQKPLLLKVFFETRNLSHLINLLLWNGKLCGFSFRKIGFYVCETCLHLVSIAFRR